jgi:hypothetical protein
MRPAVCLLVLSVLAPAPARMAAAQERPGSVYVLAGVAVAHQDGARDGDSQIYIAAPGGTTVGWSVAGGVFVASHVSLEGEWSWTGMMSAREPARYGMTYVEERRDRLLGAILRVHTRPGRRVDIEPLAGVAAVRRDRWSQTETYRSWLPPERAVEIGPRVRYDTLTSAAFIAGVDLCAGGRHVAFGPSFRVRATARGDDVTAYYPGGFPTWSIGVGAYARFDF